MSDTGNMIFSMNELVAIHSALEIQVDYCNEALKDPDFTLEEKAQFSKSLQHSISAIARLDAIFKENKINPHRN